MIRQPTIIAFALCVALGISLFLVKYDVQSLEEELIKIDRQAAADQEAIHVLKAEWSFLTQPARLADLASRHLSLHPLTANQIGDFDQLALRTDRATAPTPSLPQIAAADRPTAPAEKDKPIAAAEKNVPISAVLHAMELAAYKPASTSRQPGLAAAKPRTTP